MADRDPQVMEFVKAELGKNPSIKTVDLYEKAKAKFEGIGSLTVRQFHARYPLQVKRMASGAKGGRRKGGAARPRRPASRPRAGSPARRGDARGKVRNILLGLVRDVAGAETRTVVDVVAGIDKYVDEVVKAAG